MRTTRIFWVSLLLCYLTIIPMASNAASDGTTYEVGTTFTLDIDVRLNSGTGWYNGYTEHETEIRNYEILDVEGDTVSWQYYRDYNLDSNEYGFDESDESTYTFQSSASTRQYLDGTHDGATDANYYKEFDKIWIRIHPDELSIGDTTRILGFDYTYEGMEAVRLSPFKAVDAMKLTTKNQRFTVQETDYDPDDFELEVEFSETFYYHPETGYLLKSRWQATGYTDFKGTFEWDEQIVLTESSFPVEGDSDALVQTYIPHLVILGTLLGLTAIIITGFWQTWKYQVEKAIDIISGERAIPPNMYNEAVSTWDPSEMKYQLLLDDFTQGTKKVMMEHGVYLVVETNNRLVIADTNDNRKYGNQILLQSPENLRLFYRLALGKIYYGGKEDNMLTTTPGIRNYILANKREEMGFVDKVAYDLYMSSPSAKNEMYREIATLMARRKVLDYSHGQAPLSPESHKKKVEIILDLQPREVFLVGDDDLISVTLARRGIKISLVEIDPYTCALIKGIAIQEHLPISINQIDLRDPLPSKFRNQFDLFVADPDFSIESFALFLSRGLASIRVGGVGLINFENSISQRFKARFLLNRLNVNIEDTIDETWRYTIIRNRRIPIRGYVHGKYTVVNYDDDLILEEATYTTKTFKIRKDQWTTIPLSPANSMYGDKNSIYDY